MIWPFNLFSKTIPMPTSPTPSPAPKGAVQVDRIAGKPVRRIAGTPTVFWKSGMTVDGDGSPRCYHPNRASGLDRLANAGGPGDWYGVATDNDKPSGKQVIQGPDDPAPGFYISTTALQDSTKKVLDTARYVNSEKIPYSVLPENIQCNGRMGDFGTVINLNNGRVCHIVWADVGPHDEIGEGSIYLAKQIGVNPDCRKGGAPDGILFILHEGSRLGPSIIPTLTEINTIAGGHFSRLDLDFIKKTVS